MQNRWNENEAATYVDDALGLRAYSSRLLGVEEDLVLHGGGNTSLKAVRTDSRGRAVDTLFVKGSGLDLATIDSDGFAAIPMETLLRLAEAPSLSDSEFVSRQREAMLDPAAPNPSVESILHALIPLPFVDHTHADAALAIMNTPNGLSLIQELYGERVIVIPYTMPGFALARNVRDLTRDNDWDRYEGMVLMNHGLFTFGSEARESYDRMIRLASEAEDYLQSHGSAIRADKAQSPPQGELTGIQSEISKARGIPVVVGIDDSDEAVGFSTHPQIESLATRGPLTPDHAVFAKRIPVILGEDPMKSIAAYVSDYRDYFERHATTGLQALDPAPRWAVWPGIGILSFGKDAREVQVIGDIASHTAKVAQQSESIGGWQPLPESAIFQVEYWQLEQAKLQSAKDPA